MPEQLRAMEVLSQALRLEKEGLEFYLRAADQVVDERCEQTLRSLADDERRHIDMIQRQMQALRATGEHVALPNLEVQEIDLGRKIFPPDPNAVKERIGVDASLLHILHVALENEMRSYDLYREAAAQAADEDARRMYTWLASAELTHFNLLMSNYEAVSAGASWV